MDGGRKGTEGESEREREREVEGKNTVKVIRRKVNGEKS